MAKMDQKHFLQSVQSLLRYHRILGFDNYPASDQLKRFFRYSPEPSRNRSKNIRDGEAGKIVPAVAATPSPPLVTLADLEQEIAECQACDLCGRRIRPVPGKGFGKARLMVVGDWLFLEEAEADGQQPRLFGEDQDIMLSRMLKAISLSIENVFITNVIKCGISQRDQPQANHLQTCYSYLGRQIDIVRPELICTMGMIATRSLLGKSQPLSKMRGRLYSFTLPGGDQIPVLPTYHPTFLLQNPEMKKATWGDLQLIARTLNLKIA